MLRDILFCLVFVAQALLAANLHYSLHKKETKTGPLMLVIGGIHGDEPGGYYAPQIFLKKYTITSGNVWVVPNLNFDSIIANKRGVYGDMNRKFDEIKKDDKDFQVVSDIKKLMIEPKVDIILNLHDGHGFYRQKRVNGLLNPEAWGQALIIDQKAMQGNSKFGNLEDIAKRVSKSASVSLIEDVHEFNVKNTLTKDKDKEMQKSLTYYAIRNGKPAFAVETSKNITDTATKVLYQLKSLEEFMNVMGIKYSRNFELNTAEINKLLAQNGEIVFAQANTILPLDDIRDKIGFFPVGEKTASYTSDNPLIGIKVAGGAIGLYNGNKKLSFMKTTPLTIDKSLPETDMQIDGKQIKSKLATTISAKNSFKVMAPDGYRVNIIGFSAGSENENNIEVQKSKIDNKYSVDKSGNIFRVEFYKGKAYCGNIIVKFEK